MMLNFERQAYAQGMDLIAGIDEVGRGPLAGPVVTAAVILPKIVRLKVSTTVRRFQNLNMKLFLQKSKKSTCCQCWFS